MSVVCTCFSDAAKANSFFAKKFNVMSEIIHKFYPLPNLSFSSLQSGCYFRGALRYHVLSEGLLFSVLTMDIQIFFIHTR